MVLRVAPTGSIEDGPNLTDKRYPGSPTKSYRIRHPLRVIGKIMDWQGHAPDQLKAMRDHLEHLKQLGVEAIEDYNIKSLFIKQKNIFLDEGLFMPD